MKKTLLILALLLGMATAHALPFVTTPSPTTYPIHWYKLKIGGYYLCSSYGELTATQSSSSSDDYLWCFLAFNSGDTEKVVVYNKALGKSMSEGWEFTQYLYSQSTNWVEEGSGNNFYICANLFGSKSYMSCYEGQISFSPSKSEGDPVTAIQALVEDYIDSGETIVFSDLEVQDDYCSISFTTDNHQYACEYILYANGQRVGMPYTIQRTNEVQTVEAEAHVVYSNPRIRELVANKTYEIPALYNGQDFVTTPSPTTLPIHWYQLKINDKYVYYDPNGGVYNQIKLTSTASSENNFLWCFVQASSDKIVIYNRAAQKYLEQGQYFTSDINDSYISCVDDKDGPGFYIKYYHRGDNCTYYLFEDIGEGFDQLGSTGLLYAGVFNAIEVLVEENVVPVAETTLTPYDVYTPNNVQTDTKEDYYKLFDKDRSTKWCVDNSTGSWETIWVDFKSNVAFIPTKYVMTTAGDTYSWQGRNPKKWKIYAKENENDDWTTIVDVSDGAAAGLGTSNTTDYSFDINGVTKKYQFFRFEVSEVCGRGGWQNNHYVFQLAELALSGYTTGVVAGDVNGDGVCNAADVTALYNYILNNDTTALKNGDQNGDNVINAGDVTCVYNVILGN